MSNLKYIISADDSDFKKKIANVAKLASKSGGEMVAEVNKTVEKEVRKRKEVTKAIHEQTQAIRQRNKEESKIPLEINRGAGGSIASGTVVSANDMERAAKASEAVARSSQMAKKGLEDQAVAVNKVTVAQVKQLGLMEKATDRLNDLKRARTEATNPARIKQYNAEIQKTESEIKRMSNVGKVGFDDMGNAVQKSTGLMNKAWSAIRKLAYIIPGLGIAGVAAFAIDPIMKWISSIGQATESTKAFNKIKQEAASATAKEVAETELLIGKINNQNTSERVRQDLLDELIAKNPNVLGALNLQNIATLEGKEAIDDYIVSLKEKIRLQSLEKGYVEAVQKAADARSGMLSDETDLKGYNKVARTIGDILLFRTQSDTDKYIEDTNKKRREEAGKTYDVIAENLLKQIETEAKSAKKIEEIKDTSLRALEEQLAKTNQRLRSAQEGEDTKTLQAQKKALEDQIKQREQILGLDKKKAPAAGAEAKQISAAQNMYERIDSLRQEYTRKVMTQDEAEIQSARDKFANLAADIAKFNANPKNKVKVSTEGIDTLRDQVIADLLAKQQAARDKKAAEEKEKSLKEALKLAETHEQKLTALQKRYADARAEIGATITKEQIEALDKGLQNETDTLNRNLVEQLDSYRYFFDNIGNLSGARLSDAITNLDDDLAKLVDKYPELKKFADVIRKQIAGAKTASTAEDFRNIADALSFMADSLQDVEGGFADLVRSASNLAGQVSNIKNDISAFSTAMNNGNTMGAISSGLGIIGSGFNIMNSINSFLDRSTKADEQRLRNSELQLQATEGMTKALERQIKVAQEAYGTQKIEEYTKAIEQARKTEVEAASALAGRYVLTGDAEIDKLINKVNRGERLKKFKLWGDSEREVWRGVSGGLTEVTTDIERLQWLLDNGKLDEQTAQIAQNFINANDAIKEAEMAIMSFNTAIDFDTLSDNLIDAISSGNDAIKELGDNFEDTMKNAILNSLRDGQFKKEMEAWYKAFDAAMEGGLTDTEVASLREEYMRIGEEQRKRLLDYERATGIDLDGSSKESGGSGLSGTIGRSITEDTANKWMGVQLNIYTINKNMYTEMLSQTKVMQGHMNFAQRNLDAALGIERNTANTVLRLDTAIAHLTTIAGNTKPAKTAKDLGI